LKEKYLYEEEHCSIASADHSQDNVKDNFLRLAHPVIKGNNVQSEFKILPLFLDQNSNLKGSNCGQKQLYKL
jgi:hypothetical protein